jgi:hypothetical protein
MLHSEGGKNLWQSILGGPPANFEYVSLSLERKLLQYSFRTIALGLEYGKGWSLASSPNR